MVEKDAALNGNDARMSPSQKQVQAATEAAREKAVAYWGVGEGTINGVETEVFSVSPVLEPEAQELLGEIKAFRVRVANPMSRIAGPGSFGKTLIQDGETTLYLNSYEEVASFLSSRKLCIVSDERSARRALAALAQLSELQVPTAEHRAAASPVSSKHFSARDWETAISPGPSGWHAEAAYLVDEEVYHFARLAITFSKTGELSLSLVKGFALRHYS